MKTNNAPQPNNPGASLPDTTNLGGCMGIVFVGILILFGLGFWAWIQSPQWFAALVDNRMEAGINDSSLSDSEKGELLEVIYNMTGNFRSGTLVWKDLPNIIDAVSESEFAPLAFSIFIEASIISPSGLTDSEKQFAHQQLMRLQWAEMNDKVPDEQMESIWRQIGGTQQEAKSIHLKNDLSDDQLRAFFKECETVMNQFEVPLNPFDIDPSDALKNALKDYLSEPTDIGTATPQ